LPFIKRAFIIAAIILSTWTICRLNVFPVSSAPRPVIDTDSPAYSHLAREILISGYDLQASLTYFLWLQKPGLQNASYTGISFVATTTGGVPYPNVNIALDIPPALGTYGLTISTSSTFNSASAGCHFGVIGPARALYQRREIANFVGGGVLPGSTVRIDIRNPMDALVSNMTAIANDAGEFEYTWPIPNNVQVGTWTMSVGGIGTYDNSFERHRADGQFGIVEASLKLSIHQQPLSLYQRAETARIAFIVKYPDQSPVTTIKPGVKPVFVSRTGIKAQSLPLVLTDAINGIWTTEYTIPVFVSRTGIKAQSLPLVLTDAINGIWTTEYTIPRNETLGKDFTFTVSAGSFDDGFGNKAPSSILVSSQFEVASAQLTISILSPKHTYEILFESISLNATVKYPDGSHLVDGKVSAIFESGTLRDVRPLVFHERSRSWILTYYLAISEIQRIGTWKMTLTAEDAYGNSGAISLEIGVRAFWLIVVVATSSVLAVVLVKWVGEETGLRKLLKRRRVTDKAS